MQAFNWAALLRAGLGSLRLRPNEFWALTPAELQMMLGQQADAQPLTRSRLNRLLEDYPDNPKGDDDGGS